MDLAVESFAHGIGDPMSEVGQEVGEMAFEGLGDFHHGRQSAADRPAVPVIKELLRVAGVAILPEPTELFLDRPGPRGF